MGKLKNPQRDLSLIFHQDIVWHSQVESKFEYKKLDNLIKVVHSLAISEQIKFNKQHTKKNYFYNLLKND